MTGFATQLHDAGADVHVGFFPRAGTMGPLPGADPADARRRGPLVRAEPKSKTHPPAFKSIGRALPASVLQQIAARRHARCLALKPTQHNAVLPAYRAAHGIH